MRKSRCLKKEEVEYGQLIKDSICITPDTIDWGDCELTRRQRAFVFWYTYPLSDSYMNASKSAVKAGYSRDSSWQSAYKVRHLPKVDEAIERIRQGSLSVDIMEAYYRAIYVLKLRAFYDIRTYFKYVVKKDPITGAEYREEVIKDMDELTEEQTAAIDGMEYRGTKGIKVYIFADRDFAIGRIISLYQNFFCAKKKHTDDTEYDAEGIAEIIQERVRVKTRIRKRKDAEVKTMFTDVPLSLSERE